MVLISRGDFYIDFIDLSSLLSLSLSPEKKGGCRWRGRWGGDGLG